MSSIDKTVGGPRLDILFVVPPFASVRMPMIGPSLLAAACARRGRSASVFYGNIDFARLLGIDLYERIAFSSLDLMVGELAFRELAFDDDRLPSFEEAVALYFSDRATLGVAAGMGAPLTRDELESLPALAEQMVRRSVAAILARAPRVVGFSCMFQQTLAAAAVARGLKTCAPDIVTIIGGANVADEMGRAIAEHFPCFDHIVSGEADEFVTDLVEDCCGQGGDEPLPRFIECGVVTDLSNGPVPDFSDYFAVQPLALGEGGSRFAVSLPIESSRGCWWGQKNHCTFCGLNALGMGFREKNGDAFIAELASQRERYGINKFQAVDNILPRSFLRGTLQRLASLQPPPDLFYEIKSNVTEEELDLFVLAGINAVQPGIESLSTVALKRMRKGVSAEQNLWLLRECTSRGIEVVWNLLADWPGDTESEYLSIAAIVEMIPHLQPPRDVSTVIIDRFSPYFERPDEYGIRGRRPLGAYRNLYSPSFVEGIAYHFEGEFESAWRRHPELRERIGRIVDEWKARWAAGAARPKLYRAAFGGGRYFIEDSRQPDAIRRFVLSSRQSRLLEFCDRPRTAIPDFSADEVAELLELRLIVEVEEKVMTVVTDPAKWTRLLSGGRAAAPAEREAALVGPA
jgi:ribosomal peptide maturation radical SAM protein 1